VSSIGLRDSAYQAAVLTRRSVLRIFRAPRAIAFALIQPLMFVLLFAYVFAGPFTYLYGEGYIEYLMAGVCVQSIVFGAIATGVGLANDLGSGAMDRFRSLPVRGSALLIGRTTADMVRATLIVAVTTVACLILGWRTHAPVMSVAGGFALLLLVGYAFTWIGALIGLRLAHVESASTAGLLVTFPLVLVSGAFVPVDRRAGIISLVSEWNPVTATVSAMREAFGNPNPTPPGSLPLAAPALSTLVWAAVLLAIFVPATMAAFRKLAA
jgi:ABC-type polysaccharide/polyol phosphate export permease